MLDVDDFDPLDDILLSDEENYRKNKLPIFTNDFSKPEKTFKDEDRKKNIFNELFGKQNEQNVTSPVINNKDPADWLNLKGSPEHNQLQNVPNADFKLDQINVLTTSPHDNFNSNINLKSETKNPNWVGLFEDITETNSSNLIGKETNVDISNLGNSNNSIEIIAERRKSDIPTSASAQNAFKKKSSHFKSLEIDLGSELNDAQIISKEKKSNDTAHISNIEPKISITGFAFKNQSSLLKERTSNKSNKEMNLELETAYVPSAGTTRRHGLGKSKELPNRFLGLGTDLTITSNRSEKKKSENLPIWLDGNKDDVNIGKEIVKKYHEIEDSKKATGKIQDEVTTTQGDLNLPQNESDLEGAAKEVHQLSELKKKQSELYFMVKNQVDLFSKHEKEIKETALHLISKQHENINSLVQMVISPTFDRSKNRFDTENSSIKMEDDSDKLAFQLRIKIKELELDNTDLEMRLQFTERKNELQIASLEEAYNQKLNFLSEHEIRLKQEIEMMEEEYRTKIMKQKQSEDELIQSYKDRVEYLQNERMADLRKMEELNKFVRNTHSTTTLHQEQWRNENGRNLTDPELSVREESIFKKEKQLMELQDDLNHQKIVFESKKSGFEEKADVFELKCSKEKMNIEQQKKELKRTQAILLQKEEMWQREKDREMEYLSNYKQEIELAKENLLKEEKKIMRQRFELAAEKSRLEAFTQFEGITPGRMMDAIQARAEVQIVIDEARSLKSTLDEERKLIKTEEKKLKQERWKLREVEEELAMKMKYVERLVEQANTKREDGKCALRKAKKIEQGLNDKMEDIAEKMSEVHTKENNILMEKMAISKEREMLNKYRMEFDNVVVHQKYPFNSMDVARWGNSFFTSNKEIIDPKYFILKMKAEQNNFNPTANVVDIS